MMCDDAIAPAHDLLLDATGLLCPLPLLKTKQALKKLAPGQILQVLATDPATEKDMKTLLSLTANELLFFDKQQHVFCFFIQKKTVIENAI